MDPRRITKSVFHEALTCDALLVELARKGLSKPQRHTFFLALDDQRSGSLRRLLRDVGDKPHALLNAVLALSHPRTGPSDTDVNLLELVDVVDEVGQGCSTVQALLALCTLAVLEGQVVKYGPRAAYPHISLELTRRVGLRIALWLQASGAHSSAAVLAQLLRELTMGDPRKREAPEGRVLVDELREVERVSAMHLRNCKRELAWQLHDNFEECRPFVAAIFFALGDPVRALGIARDAVHQPRISVLLDMVETSVALVRIDPLLQGCWLALLGSTRLDIHMDLRLRMRNSAPEENTTFKGFDEVVKQDHGMSIASTYTQGVLQGLTGAIRVDPSWRDVLQNVIVPALPGICQGYLLGFARLLELVSMISQPGSPLPHGERLTYLMGEDPREIYDIRDAARILLRLDLLNANTALIGQSLAHDSSFFIEPVRRNEGAEASLEALEEMRWAALALWLVWIPPFRPTSDTTKLRDVLEADRELMTRYRHLAFLATLEDRPIYAKLYGHPTYKWLLRVSRDDVMRYQHRLADELEELIKSRRAARHAYEAWRFSGPATIQQIRETFHLG